MDSSKLHFSVISSSICNDGSNGTNDRLPNLSTEDLRDRITETSCYVRITTRRTEYSNSVLQSWIKIDQLDVTCFIISLFTAQHISNASTSIFRNLRLIVDLFHVLYCSGSMCVGVTAWFGWGGVVSLCRLRTLGCFEQCNKASRYTQSGKFFASWVTGRTISRMRALLASYNATPYNRYQPHPAEPEQHTKCSNRAFDLLKMCMMMPETCWDRS